MLLGIPHALVQKSVEKQDTETRSQNLFALRKEGHKIQFLKCATPPPGGGELNHNIQIACVTVPPGLRYTPRF